MGRIEFWHGLRGSRDNHILTFFNIAGEKHPKDKTKYVRYGNKKDPANKRARKHLSNIMSSTNLIRRKQNEMD